MPAEMKIAFLTSCLEPGRDGVGDYTTLLAAECARQGHSVCRVALNDPHVLVQRGADCLRLGAMLPWAVRVEKARAFLARFAPDWVSVQFVCYGFHPRGTDARLAARLGKIIGPTPVQIMFHELWIGAEQGARLRERMVGALQRRVLMQLVRTLAPRVVHTSNAVYAGLLRDRGVAASRLPLFGNVPVLSRHKHTDASGDAWTFGLFGTLHPVWPPEPLFARLREMRKKIVIAHVGAMGSGVALWEKIARDYSGAFEFRRLGEQPPEKIAEFFAGVEFGIATTPWELVDKSGSVAAMLEHGVPVIVNRDDVHFAGWSERGCSPLLIKMDESLSAKLAAARRRTPRSILPEVASQFLADIGHPPANSRDE